MFRELSREEITREHHLFGLLVFIHTCTYAFEPGCGWIGVSNYNLCSVPPSVFTVNTRQHQMQINIVIEESPHLFATLPLSVVADYKISGLGVHVSFYTFFFFV